MIKSKSDYAKMHLGELAMDMRKELPENVLVIQKKE